MDRPDPSEALDQGKRVGAALVVVYGHFDPPADLALDPLPIRRRPSAPVVGGPPTRRPGLLQISRLGPDDQIATYWGKTRPAPLGIASRPLNEGERARLRREDGIVVDGVVPGSPADQAGLALGDVIVSPLSVMVTLGAASAPLAR